VNIKYILAGIFLLGSVLTACNSAAADIPEQVSAKKGSPQQDSSPQTVEEAMGDEGLQASGEQPNNDIDGMEPEGQITQEPGLNREMPVALALALGTFKLEDSGYPVSAEQAVEMLVLWKAARSLNESDTTAAEELDAVVGQIQGIYNAEQLAEIGAMDLSFQDMRTIAEQMGIELGFGGRFGDLTPEQQATMEAARESGQFPQGGFGGDFPGGGPGGGPGGAGMSPEQRETAIAERGGFQRVNLGLPLPVLEALIEFLESKTG
jgi:hypothetical protein